MSSSEENRNCGSGRPSSVRGSSGRESRGATATISKAKPTTASSSSSSGGTRNSTSSNSSRSLTGTRKPPTSNKATSNRKSKSESNEQQQPSKFQQFKENLPKKGKGAEAVFGEATEQEIHPKILKAAQSNGILNLSGKGIVNVPEKVWKLNEPDESNSKSRGFSMDAVPEDNWWDRVDLTKLILANNQIVKISPMIAMLESLTVLDLHDNLLETLPDEVGKLTNLTKLNLNHNKLKTLPQQISELKNLRGLTVAHNEIHDISDGISRLDMLDHLDLAHNKLTHIPNDIGYLTKVTHFNLSHNELKTLPEEFSFMRSLKMLDLSNNVIEKLPEYFKDLHHLEVIYLKYNKIVKLPQLDNCTNLKELHLGNNCISEITPQDVESIRNVVLLDLRDNRVISIPDEIINLQSLERLDISNNDLFQLPFTIGILPNMKSLQVDGNPMKGIRRDIIARGTVGLMKYLKSRIDERELSRLQSMGRASPDIKPRNGESSSPVPDKYSMKSSSLLGLANKDIEHLKDEAVENAVEAGVTGVDLSKNRFSTIPSNLSKIMGNLTEFNMSANKIEGDMPEVIGESSKKLMYLNMAQNKLTGLTPIVNFNVLREVNLNYNRFSEIPSQLYDCPLLETILMTANRVTEIDVPNLSKLKKLAILDLSNNNIAVIPPELGNLTQIQSLQIEGNAFRVPRSAILVKGTSAIMSYLRDRIPDQGASRNNSASNN